MNLSRNFTLSELTKSDTAIRKGINNNPNAEQIEKLKLLCENILQPVRDHFGRVKITSGFRSSELCVAIGSSVNSQHARAEAGGGAVPRDPRPAGRPDRRHPEIPSRTGLSRRPDRLDDSRAFLVPRHNGDRRGDWFAKRDFRASA